MTPDETYGEHRAQMVDGLEPAARGRAVVVLICLLFKYPDMQRDLSARIAENPLNWLMGREDAPCGWCRAGGIGIDGSPCKACGGSTRSPEMPLHHGWGTGIRNYLRQHGCGEAEMGVDNLDDIYSQLVELAVARVGAVSNV